MDLKPILLEASVRAVFDSISRTFRTLKVRYELLVKLLVAVLVEGCGLVDAVLLVFPDVLERTFVIFTLAHMDELVIWRRRDLPNSTTGSYRSCIHHGRVIEAALGEKAYAHVPIDSLILIHFLIFLLLSGLHLATFFIFCQKKFINDFKRLINFFVVKYYR